MPKKQLAALAKALREGYGITVNETNDRLYLTRDDFGGDYHVIVNNDGTDKFYELRDEFGLVTTVDLPVELDELVDQLTQSMIETAS